MKSIKKLSYISLALIMVLGLVSCAPSTQSTPTNTQESTIPETLPTTNAEISEAPETEESYVFLVYNSESGSPTLKSSFGNPLNYGIYTSSTRIISEDARKTFVSPLTQEAFEYKYSRCSYKDNTKTKYGTHYCIVDTYEANGVSIDVLHGTDLVLYYSNVHSIKESEKVSISYEEARNVADEFLSTMLSEEIFQKYEKASVSKDSLGLFSHVVYYKRPLHGYETEETLGVYIGLDGKVEGYNGYGLCKLDHCRDNVTKEQIDTARDTLLEKLKSLDLKNFVVESTSLVVNTEGKLFLQIAYMYSHEDGGRAEIALINVI